MTLARQAPSTIDYAHRSNDHNGTEPSPSFHTIPTSIPTDSRCTSTRPDRGPNRPLLLDASNDHNRLRLPMCRNHQDRRFRHMGRRRRLWSYVFPCAVIIKIVDSGYVIIAVIKITIANRFSV